MDRLKGSNYRNAIVEIVEGILKDCPYEVVIDSNEDGELIEFTEKGVTITFSYTYEKSEGILDFSRFTINFHVFSGLSIMRFSSLNSVVIKYIQDEFLRLYSLKKEVLKKDLQKKKADGGFQQSLIVLSQVIQKVDLFDTESRFFQIMNYLLVKNMSIPEQITNYQEIIQYLKINHSEFYEEMIMQCLESDDFVKEKIGV